MLVLSDGPAVSNLHQSHRRPQQQLYMPEQLQYILKNWGGHGSNPSPSAANVRSVGSYNQHAGTKPDSELTYRGNWQTKQPSPCWNPEYDQNLAIQLCSLNSTNGSIFLAFSVPCLGCIFHTLSLMLCKPAHSHMDLFGATENCWSLRGEFYYGLKFWAMLYIYSLNFWTGPKMEPCGTPLVTSYHFNFNQQFHTARKALLL